MPRLLPSFKRNDDVARLCFSLIPDRWYYRANRREGKIEGVRSEINNEIRNDGQAVNLYDKGSRVEKEVLSSMKQPIPRVNW